MDIKFLDDREDGLRFHRKGDVLWLSSPILDAEPWLLHGMSTRFGGVSTGHLASMNLSFAQERDHRENVEENFRRIADAIGFPPESIVMSDQTHTSNVLRVGVQDRGKGLFRRRYWTDIDGFITNEPDTVLSIFTADCVPVFLADPVHRAIGLVHSGWRGTAARISEVAVQEMGYAFRSRPEDMIASIGPCICRDCYEVSADVAEQFPAEVVRDRGNGKYDLDLMEANRRILEETGIPRQAISMPDICTCCNPDLLFSHRATGGKRGNMGSFLMIRG